MRRSPHDREILRLAVPALGALAAEPLYILVDTAIVGHLGTPQLAAVAIAGTILTSLFTLCNFLTYGTTAQVARYHGAGEEAIAGRLGAQALWLSLGIGTALVVLVLALATPAVALMGGRGEVGEMAVSYLRISALGAPFALIALAGQGFLRGLSSLRRPLVIVIAGNGLNVVLEVLFVYGFGWGVEGSAWSTVIAQAAMGAAFVRELLSAPADDRRPRAGDRRPRADLMRPLTRISGDIAVRTGALLTAFVVASAVLARVGEASLGAHQVAFQLFVFLALVLDAIAIAGQVIVGRTLGSGDAPRAYEASCRMIGWALAVGTLFALGLLVLGGVLPHAFTDDPAVIERAHAVWPLFALMQPVAAVVFALDGILIGAGDTRFLKWAMLVSGLGVYVPVALASLALGWGIVGVWGGLIGFILMRLATGGLRFVGRRWAITGAPASA